jgi:Tol biopolymer transport system component
VKRLVTLIAVGGVLLAGGSAAGGAAANGLIAFTSDFDEISPRGIWVVRPDSSGLRRIGDGSQPAWSPDGRHLALTDDDDVFVMASDGTGRRKLIDAAGEAAWSPDGTRLVVRLRSAAFDGDLFVLPAEGGTPTRVTGGPEDDSWPSWSPDGARILFERNRDAWSVAPDGTNARLLRDDARRPRLSPDGTLLAYESQGGVYVAPASGGAERRVSPEQQWSGGPAWAPDGTRVAFTAGGRVCTVRPDGTDSRQATFTVAYRAGSDGEEPVSWQPTDAASLSPSRYSCDDPSWDLSAGVTASIRRSRLGGVVTYRAVVRNLGPDPAWQTSWGLVLPEDAEPFATSNDRGMCRWELGSSSVNFLACEPRVLFPGQSATVVVSARLLAPGPLRATAAMAVYAGAIDRNGENDTGGATVVVAGCTITGTYGADVLRGTARRDVICGLGGDDRIRGLGGNDEIWGGAGRDVIDAGPGDDRVRAGGGDDVVEGLEGNDVVWGGYGRDSIWGGAGDDALRGGEAGGRVADSAPFLTERDRVDGGAGADVVDGGVGADILRGGLGPDLILARDGHRETAACGAGRDRVVADRLDRTQACERVARG